MIDIKVVEIDGVKHLAIPKHTAENLLWEIDTLKEHLPANGSELVDFCKTLTKLFLERQL